MPKRRVITAKQRAASRRNLIKARAARQPRGKQITLYHRTSSKAARAIVSTGQFRPDLLGRAHFSNRKKGMANGFGSAVVSVKVPAVAAQRAKVYGFNFGKSTGEKLYTVPVKHLTGKKVTRIRTRRR